MVPDEEEKIERYIWGLPDNIQGNVTSAGTTRLQDRIRVANILMDQRIRVIATRMLTTKESGKMSKKEIIASNKTRGKKWLGYTLLELVNLMACLLDVLGSLNLIMISFMDFFLHTNDQSVGGLPDMIQGSVVASKPKTIQEATEMTSELMDKKINTIAKRQAENKRKFENTSRNNQNQQDKKTRGRTLAEPTLQDLVIRNRQGPTCFECGVWGHIKTDCLKLKNNNNNRGNHVRNDNALAKVYVVGHAGTNPDSNVVAGTFLLNNRYASILFNTGADRSFVSTI
ncbi:putative reverse transcriptase domain-containing protein [Tanacetum coccineum]